MSKMLDKEKKYHWEQTFSFSIIHPNLSLFLQRKYKGTFFGTVQLFVGDGGIGCVRIFVYASENTQNKKKRISKLDICRILCPFLNECLYRLRFIYRRFMAKQEISFCGFPASPNRCLFLTP